MQPAHRKLKRPALPVVKTTVWFFILNFACATLAWGAVAAAPAGTETPGDEAVDTYREMWSDAWFVRHSIIIGGLLLVLLACFLIRRRRRTMEIFTNEGGAVHVSHFALADLVENTARQYGAASRPRAYFARRGGKLHVWVRMKISAGQRLPQFSSGLQTRIASALHEAFGIGELGGVHIVVTGYSGTPVPEEESPVPYHGAAPAKPAKPAPPQQTGGDYFAGR